MPLIDRATRTPRGLITLSASLFAAAALVLVPATAASADPGSIDLGGGGQSAPAGQSFAEAVFAQVFETDGSPSGVVPVVFEILPAPGGALLASFDPDSQQSEVDTSTASTGSTLGQTLYAGETTGTFQIRASVPGTAIETTASFTVLPAVAGPATIDELVPALTSIEVRFTPGTPGGLPTTGYRVEARQTASGALTVAEGPASPITVPGLESGATYDVTVIALRDQWQSAPSAAKSTTLLTLPGQPSITEWGGGYSTALVDFTPGAPGNPPATRYDVTLTNNTQVGFVITIPTTQTNFQANDLPYGDYTACVVAVSPIGQSAPACASPIHVYEYGVYEPAPDGSGSGGAGGSGTGGTSVQPASGGSASGAPVLAASGTEVPVGSLTLGGAALLGGMLLVAIGIRRRVLHR